MEAGSGQEGAVSVGGGHMSEHCESDPEALHMPVKAVTRVPWF